jgi:DNA-binding MarR family transcriptional regulator
MNMRETDADFALWILFNTCKEIIHDLREKELKRYGITVRQAGIIYAISNDLEDYAKPSEIARVSHREPNSISTIIDRMERKGLIKKGKDLHRKNVIRISLTEKGKEAHVMTYNRRSIHRVFACLSEEEIGLLQSCFNKLIARALQEQKTNNLLD